MIFIGLVVVNILFVIVIKIYCKLTSGICKSSRHLVGKVVIVTGGNAGIGYETARDLADRGARVILGCRSEARGTAARFKIIEQTGNTNVHYQHLDLASLASVRRFANNILATEQRLDVLINNAGLFEAENVKTEDGLLLAMQTNHFGPFLLTCLLLPLLRSTAPSRIINVSSLIYKYGNLDFDNLNMEKTPKDSFKKKKVYANNKLCNILMTMELERRLKGTRVTANCLHPGLVETDLVNGIKSKLFKIFKPLQMFMSKNAWEGAQTTIYLAVSPEVNEVSGGYFSDCQLRNTTKIAQDPEVARKLWEVSEMLVKLN